MNSIADLLLLVTTGLLIPIVVGLFVLALLRLLDLGGLAREWWERRRGRNSWQALSRSLARSGGEASTFEQALPQLASMNTWVGTFAHRALQDELHPLLVERHASQLEIETAGRLARLSFAIRVAPMLGLIGTLIPLGPALMNLSTGDIDGMAQQLVVAFGTTVLGLVIGGAAFGQWLVRRQWYASDLADIEFLQQALETLSDPRP